MHAKISKRLFCILFFLLCLTPLAVFLLTGPADTQANERLAPRPRLTAGGRLNPDVLSDAADYFAGRFGLRQELITANAALDAAVFRESAAADVILGADGWLYYAETLPCYTGSGSMTPRQLWCAARNLALLQEYAAASGAQTLFVCAPNKNTIYPAQMPARYVRAEGTSDLDRLQQALTAAGVPFCDVRPALAGARTLTYYRTDSHWNGFGSALAHDAIVRALGREGSLAEEAFTPQPHRGDLYAMLYPASKAQEDAPALARARTFRYQGAFRDVDDQRIETVSDGSGTLVMFRDSFGNALHADLAEDFAAAVFSRAMPYDASLLQQAQAGVLLVELAERNLSWLCTRPPLLPAPVRETPQAQPAAGTVSVRKSASAFDGLQQYDAVFDAPDMDDDSPVFAVLDGVCYEACPTDTGFRLTAPDAESIRVIVWTGGTPIALDAALS